MQVELPAFVEKGPFDIFLQQERPRLITMLQYFPQFLHDLGSRQQLHLVLVIAALSRLDQPQLFLVLQHGKRVEVNVCPRRITDEVCFGKHMPRIAIFLFLVVVLQQLEKMLAFVEDRVVWHVIGNYDSLTDFRIHELIALLVNQRFNVPLVFFRYEQTVHIILRALSLPFPCRALSLPFPCLNEGILVFLVPLSALLVLVDAIHVVLGPVELAFFGIVDYLVPEALPQYLLNHKLVVSRADVDPDSRGVGMAEGQVCAESVCELHFEVEIELYFEFLHVCFLVVIGVDAERLSSLKGLQFHVSRSLLRKILTRTSSNNLRSPGAQLFRHRSIKITGTAILLAGVVRLGALALQFLHRFAAICIVKCEAVLVFTLRTIRREHRFSDFGIMECFSWRRLRFELLNQSSFDCQKLLSSLLLPAHLLRMVEGSVCSLLVTLAFVVDCVVDLYGQFVLEDEFYFAIFNHTDQSIRQAITQEYIQRTNIY